MKKNKQRQEIERATKLWAEVAPIDFKLVRGLHSLYDIYLLNCYDIVCSKKILVAIICSFYMNR